MDTLLFFREADKPEELVMRAIEAFDDKGRIPTPSLLFSIVFFRFRDIVLKLGCGSSHLKRAMATCSACSGPRMPSRFKEYQAAQSAAIVFKSVTRGLYRELLL